MKHDIEKKTCFRSKIILVIEQLLGGTLEEAPISSTCSFCTDKAYFYIKLSVNHQNNSK